MMQAEMNVRGVSSALPLDPTTPFDEPEASVIRRKLAMAWEFTQTYKRYADDHVAIREAMCLRAQYPALCREIKDYDLIAGRLYYYPLVAFGIELYGNRGIRVIHRDDAPEHTLSAEDLLLHAKLGNSDSGFHYDYGQLKEVAEYFEPGSEERRQIDELNRFWWDESTRAKYNAALPEEIRAAFGKSENDNRYVSAFFRLACVSVDFDTLLQEGLSSMAARIRRKIASARHDGGDSRLYEGMLIALEVVADVCRHYEEQVRHKADATDNPHRRADLGKMAEALGSISCGPPRTFREALQLFWIYNILTGTLNYGRIDVYLGDFYVRDLREGSLTEADALALLKSLWKIISEQRHDGWDNARANTRMIVGGRGRRNEDNADRFALLAMETARQMRVTEPNLTLRFYQGQNPALYERALELLGEGCVHPGLYNDDAYISWVRKAYGVSREDAESYVPEGCGEIMLDHRSVGSPNTVIKLVTALDLILHNGLDATSGVRRGLPLGTLDSFATFEQLCEAVKRQIDYTFEMAARRHAIEHRIEGENGAYLFMSMLTDDCIERGRPLFGGGTRYLGGIVETFGLTNLSDSLVAIGELVYKKKALSLPRLVEILDADFEGFERERRMMLNQPKFGNDDEVADSMHSELSAFVCESAHQKARAVGLDFFLVCNLNTGGIRYGGNTKASADGRRFGEPFAVGNAPTAGRDHNGLTALLNSMAKHDKRHAGYVHNLKVSKRMFTPANKPKLRALLDGYFASGGIQLMVTAINADDLHNARRDPEKYANLLVRVGGWTSRYVELPESFQVEILNRTLYC